MKRYNGLPTSVVNVVFDLIFVGPLKMGVAGAALATVISQACSAVFVLIFLFSKKADEGYVPNIDLFAHSVGLCGQNMTYFKPLIENVFPLIKTVVLLFSMLVLMLDLMAIEQSLKSVAMMLRDDSISETIVYNFFIF